MNTKFVSINDNNGLEIHSGFSSSTPKPTITPPPQPSTVIQNENLYHQQQQQQQQHIGKYTYQSPALNSYYSTPIVSQQTYIQTTSTSTPVNYYNNYNTVDNHYQNYSHQYSNNNNNNNFQLTDSGYNSSYNINNTNSSIQHDTNYYKTTPTSYENHRQYYSVYESPILSSTTKPVQKSNKLFTIDSILNSNSNNNNNKENEKPNDNLNDNQNNEEYFNEDEININKIIKKSGRLSSKRVRTIFTQDQLDKLEAEFLKQQYMVGSERYYLANELNLNEAQVKIWFQNRRIKWRKENIEQKRSTGKLNNNNENSNTSINIENDSISHE